MDKRSRAKDFLRRAYRLHESIASKKEQLIYLRTICESTTQKPDELGTKVQGGAFDAADSICIMINLQIQLSREIALLGQAYLEIKRAVEKLTNRDLRLILEYRYLTYNTLEDTADKMNYSVRHISRLHDTALDELAEIIEKYGYLDELSVN